MTFQLARVFGSSIGIADAEVARATKIAQPGTVLVPERLKDEVDDAADYAFRRIGHRRLKGFDQPITLYALRRAKGAVA